MARAERAAAAARTHFEAPLRYRVDGEAIGRGAQKSVYPALGHPDVVVRVLHERAQGTLERVTMRHTGPADPRRLVPFHREHRNLELARAWGLPAAHILAHGQAQVDGVRRPADAIARRSMGSKELLSLSHRDRRAYHRWTYTLFGGENGRQALAQLNLFDRAFKKGLVIEDFQLMFAPGRVEYTDSSGIYDGGKRKDPITLYWRAGQTLRLRQMRAMVKDGLRQTQTVPPTAD